MLAGKSQRLSYMAADREARNPDAVHCVVRCCPITSQSKKDDGSEYELFMIPNGAQGDIWIEILRKTDYQFRLRASDIPHICERHFAATPRLVKSAFPQLHLRPSEAAMSRAELDQVLLQNRPEPVEFEEESAPCPCCRDVEICHQTLRRFNTKMNTLMQHVNMLCVLEGVKEVVPRPFDDIADDNELYSGDQEKVAVLATARAASMFVSEAKNEVNRMHKALDTMGPVHLRRCALYRCPATRETRSVDSSTFEEDLESGALCITAESERKNLRILLAKSRRITLCSSHWIYHTDNKEVLFEDDDEEAIKLKEILAIPTVFQPKYKKMKMTPIEPEGGSKVVKVEVRDDEEEDERLLSNNELLQQLLGGAVAGQVTGEIGDNGEVYEGGEDDAEMEELDNQEATTEDEREDEDEKEEEGEKESEEDPHDEPPELD